MAGLDEGDTHSGPSSPRLDRLSIKSDSVPDLSSVGEDRTGEVVVALLASLLQPEEDVRLSAASSLALLAQARPGHSWSSLSGTRSSQSRNN